MSKDQINADKVIVTDRATGHVHDSTFWKDCAQLGVTVIPFIAYSQYDSTGNHSSDHCLGLRFVCIET